MVVFSFVKTIAVLIVLFSLASCIAAPGQNSWDRTARWSMPSHVRQWMIARQRRANYAQVDTTLFPPRLEQVTRRQEEALAVRLKEGC